MNTEQTNKNIFTKVSYFCQQGEHSNPLRIYKNFLFKERVVHLPHRVLFHAIKLMSLKMLRICKPRGIRVDIS